MKQTTEGTMEVFMKFGSKFLSFLSQRSVLIGVLIKEMAIKKFVFEQFFQGI